MTLLLSGSIHQIKCCFDFYQKNDIQTFEKHHSLSTSASRQLLNMNNEERIKETLQGVPNCFVLRDCLVGRSKESVKHVIDGQLREIDNKIYELDNEWIRTYNFLSFLYWTLGETDKARAHNEKVLGMDDNNVIAITNKIWFSLESDDAYELNIINAKLEKLQSKPDYQVYRVKADAELAYCYTRLGLKQQETARMRFRKVIDEACDLKLDNDIGKNLIMLWKYGLGLITRRVSKLHCSRSADQVIRCSQRRKEAIETFLDVIHEQWDSERLKAMAYAQLGEISFAVLKDEQNLKDYFPELYESWDAEMFYRTALTLYDKETYILERYGQFLRYKKRYDESEKILRKSIEIRPTSHAHHHLALTLKSKFHKQLAAQNRHFNRSVSSPNKINRPLPRFRRMHSEDTHRNHNPHARNLFGTHSEKRMPGELQISFGNPCNMLYYNDYNSGQSAQRNNNYACMNYDSGYCANSNSQYSSGNKSQYHAQGISGSKKQYSNGRGSFSKTCGSNGRGSSRGNNNRYPATQGHTPSFYNQNSNTDGKMHQLNKTTHTQCKSSISQDRSLLPDQSYQLDSGIDSLSTAFQHVALQDNVERDGSVKMKAPVVSNANVLSQRQVDFFSKTEPKMVYTEGTQRISSSTLSALKVNQTKAMIKSPRKLLNLPNEDNRTKEIVYHLEQSLLYSENRAALYDKGLTLRAMQHFDEAVSVFKQLIGDESSLIYLANAYEQCGLCHNDKIQKSTIEGDDLQKCMFNMKDYFMKSVAISAKLVAAIPDISKVWASASSLKEVLLSEGNSKESLRQLAVLSERLNNYKEAISYYEDMISMEDDVKEIPKHLASVATNQMKDSEYIAAVTVLDIARTHPEGKTCIDKKIYLKCLVEAGFQAIEMGHEKQFGSKYLSSALELASEFTDTQNETNNDDDNDNSDEDGHFDMFLLCNEEHELTFSLAANVWGKLKALCGLNVTMNSMDVLWGTPKLSGRLDLVDKCKYFVIFVSNQTSEEKLYQLSLEHIVLNKSNVILMLEDADTKLPAVVKRFKDRISHLVIPHNVADESNGAHISLLKQLMLCLLRVS